jgi:farnesyl-diphosphate farnesyltransferase
MGLLKDGLDALKDTSRTFYIPISRLPPELQEGIASAYLCMRAIDDIEDHPDLDRATKVQLLKAISLTLQASDQQIDHHAFASLFFAYQKSLPEVSLRIGEWAALAPASIAPRIWDATAAMSDRMAYWAETNWTVHTEADLNCYTFSVAGAVGLMLSDLWAWYDGTQTNRTDAIGFGRGLQAVNILRNHADDLSRGVEFYPDGWSNPEMQAYARRNLSLADTYTKALPKGPALDFCKIPLTLAHATLDLMALGGEKLSRSQVLALTEQ